MGQHSTPPFSLQQREILAVLPKVSGTVSALFSSLIIWTILRDKKRRSRTYDRLLLGISFCDLSTSFWFALSTWPMPRGSAVWAVGNGMACNLQGFGVQFGVSSSFYNASLSIYYLLVVRYGWKEYQLITIERWLLHAVPLVWGSVTAIVGLVLGVYGRASLWCSVAAPYPMFRYAVFYGPLWLMIMVVTVNTLYDHVRRIERAAQRHRLFHSTVDAVTSPRGGGSSGARRTSSFSIFSQSNTASFLFSDGNSSSVPFGQEQSPTDAQRKERHRLQMQRKSQRTREVANQCLLYAGAFYFNWCALTATRIIQQVKETTYFPLLVVACVTAPVQGLPNFLIYLLPKFKRLRQEKFWPWLRHLLDSQGGNGNESTEVKPQHSQLSLPSTVSRRTTGNKGTLDVLDEEDDDGDSDEFIEIESHEPWQAGIPSDVQHHCNAKVLSVGQTSEMGSDDDEMKHPDVKDAMTSPRGYDAGPAEEQAATTVIL